jgi:hypothetical protein
MKLKDGDTDRLFGCFSTCSYSSSYHTIASSVFLSFCVFILGDFSIFLTFFLHFFSVLSLSPIDSFSNVICSTAIVVVSLL